ncbi:hypothetical protein L2E82_43892 [Cichorium intybus]|uniref:Uncharacterized protein n=1 Tax=Cichorium intybus TaxID=13427 RepID=A0ACB8ZNE8_CICIN|nr:hypothetical protein L2E82_43892 [Cichorium intybus]
MEEVEVESVHSTDEGESVQSLSHSSHKHGAPPDTSTTHVVQGGSLAVNMPLTAAACTVPAVINKLTTTSVVHASDSLEKSIHHKYSDLNVALKSMSTANDFHQEGGAVVCFVYTSSQPAGLP